MPPEFSDIAARQGHVSLAHGDDPASGDTSFFIVLARTPVLDGKYSGIRQSRGGDGRRREE